MYRPEDPYPKPFLELICSFTFVWVVFSRNCEIRLCTILVYALYFISCCSIFNDRFACPLPAAKALAQTAVLRTARLLYHTHPALSIPFFKFLRNFFNSASRDRRLFLTAWLLYYFCFGLSSIFHWFFHFLALWQNIAKILDFFVHCV